MNNEKEETLEIIIIIYSYNDHLVGQPAVYKFNTKHVTRRSCCRRDPPRDAGTYRESLHLILG